MLSLRSHALITGAIFAALAVMFALCIGLAFSAIPLMVLIVLGFQVRIGNAGTPPIRILIAHQRTIVFVLWGLMAAGLLLAIPAAILSGALDTIEFPH